MRLAFFLLACVPLAASSVTYRFGNRFSVTTADFIPALGRTEIRFSIPELGFCTDPSVSPLVYCTGAILGYDSRLGMAYASSVIYDEFEGRNEAISFIYFPTDLRHTGAFISRYRTTPSLFITQANDPVTYMPEPSSGTMVFGAATVGIGIAVARTRKRC